MNRTLTTLLLLSGLVLGVGFGSAEGQTGAPSASGSAQGTPATQAPATSPATTAIQQAADARKFIFLFFYRTEDQPTQAARKAFDAAVASFADRATSMAVNVTNPQEQALVNKYDLNRMPLPLVLAVAPTGAVTGSFPGQFTQAQMEAALVSPGMQKCLKALQDRKMAFLCVQNAATQHNAEATLGVKEFAADPQFAKSTEIIMIDPADPREASLLKQFKVDVGTKDAVTVFLAPPGATVGTYRGEVKKDVLVAAAKAAAKACDPKSGCCPTPPKPPAKPPTQPQRPGGDE